MPGLGATGLFDDEKIAAVLSYIRRAWGNAAAPIEPALIAAVRKETDGRTLPWRAEELAQVAAKTDAPPALKPAANGDLLLPASKATVFARKLAYRPTLDVLAPWIVALMAPNTHEHAIGRRPGTTNPRAFHPTAHVGIHAVGGLP